MLNWHETASGRPGPCIRIEEKWLSWWRLVLYPTWISPQSTNDFSDMKLTSNETEKKRNSHQKRKENKGRKEGSMHHRVGQSSISSQAPKQDGLVGHGMCNYTWHGSRWPQTTDGRTACRTDRLQVQSTKLYLNIGSASCSCFKPFFTGNRYSASLCYDSQ